MAPAVVPVVTPTATSGPHTAGMRVAKFFLGDGWGWKSLDGVAQADSVENRRNGVRFILELNGGMAIVAVVAVLLMALTGSGLQGINTTVLFICVGFGAFVIAPTVWFSSRVAPYWIQLLALIYEGALTVAGFAIGPRLSSTVVAFYVIQGVCVVTLATRRAAAIHVSAMGAGYALLLGLQAGNNAPVSRWLLGMGAVIFAGSAVSLLTERMRQAQRELFELNHTLQHRVAEHVEQLGRLGRLRRFLSTPVADAMLSADNDEELLKPHRREIAVFFCDLRSFTAFAASSQPEDVHHVLDEYFELLGNSIRRHNATVGAFTGDGLMAFFNDPLPCPDPALRAITMASEIQEAMESLLARWRPRGCDLGLGVGVALGYADIGMIGFEGRRDYSAIGTVVNLASRLCDEARSGEILIDERAHAATKHAIRVEDSALITLKGLGEPVLAFSARLDEADHEVRRAV
jgi:class 3 adenylate cyclase